MYLHLERESEREREEGMRVAWEAVGGGRGLSKLAAGDVEADGGGLL